MKTKEKMTAKIKAVWNGGGWDCIVKTYAKAPKFHLRRKSRVDNVRVCDEWVIPLALLEHNGLKAEAIYDELDLKAE